MSVIIKSHDVEAIASKVRPLGAAPELAPPPLEPEPPAELLVARRELEAALGVADRQKEEIGRLKKEVRTAYSEGEAAGRAAGLKDANRREEERIELLRSGVKQALETLRQEFASLERLSSLLAREALGKILADPADAAELVVRIIRRQLEELSDQSTLQVNVSSRDFDQEGATSAQQALARPGLELRCTDALVSGQCRIKLKLGEVDVGLDQQWQALSALLQVQSEPRRPA